jgi:hypothetical protein
MLTEREYIDCTIMSIFMSVFPKIADSRSLDVGDLACSSLKIKEPPKPLKLVLEALRQLLRYRDKLNDLYSRVHLLDASFRFQQDEVSNRLR